MGRMTAVLFGLSGLLLPLMAEAAESLAVFECQERLGQDWPATLVTYERNFEPGKAKPGQVRLVDATGNERPVQLWRVTSHPDGSIASARISFMAALPKNGSYRFQLQPQAPAAGAGPAIGTDKTATTLANPLVALRLPPAGEVKYDAPRKMSAVGDASGGDDAVPGPLQGVRLATSQWVGGSRLVAGEPDGAPRITGYTCRVTEAGPLFAETRIRYTFTNGGWYELTARVLADDPAVRIDEQFDTGAPGSRTDYQLAVSLSTGREDGGWRPDVAYWISAEERLKGRDERFQAALRDAGLPVPADCGSTRLTCDEPFRKVFDVAVRYPWNPNAQFFGLVRTEDVTRGNVASGKLPFLGVVPMHAGNWRGSVDPSDGMLACNSAGDVCLNWRLRASPHPRSMLHTGEYDPDQSLMLCRRQWALVGGPFQPFEKLWAFRAHEAHVTLDDYKDWVLDWPADSKVTYPRLLFGREDVERLKARADAFPEGELFKRFLSVNDTDARRRELWQKLTGDNEWSSPSGTARHLLTRGDPANIPWAVGYRVSQMTGWAGDMDELLGSDKLTPEQRARLRSDLAAFCYASSEPDVNPRGSMTHLGNPNMPINRFMGLAWAAALIPDHPMSKTWLDVSAKYLRYKLAMNTAPGGAWGELVTYYDASAPHRIQTAGVLARTAGWTT